MEPMSSSQVCAVCCQRGSWLALGSGVILFKSTLDAEAANPHRDGVSQATCSSPGLPLIGMKLPAMTTWIMTRRNTSGIARSVVLTADDTSRPMAIDTTAMSAVASAISRSEEHTSELQSPMYL